MKETKINESYFRVKYEYIFSRRLRTSWHFRDLGLNHPVSPSPADVRFALAELLALLYSLWQMSVYGLWQEEGDAGAQQR